MDECESRRCRSSAAVSPTMTQFVGPPRFIRGDVKAPRWGRPHPHGKQRQLTGTRRVCARVGRRARVSARVCGSSIASFHSSCELRARPLTCVGTFIPINTHMRNGAAQSKKKEPLCLGRLLTAAPKQEFSRAASVWSRLSPPPAIRCPPPPASPHPSMLLCVCARRGAHCAPENRVRMERQPGCSRRRSQPFMEAFC